MKVLFVNLVYGTGSTGKIIADIMNLLKKYGNDVKTLYLSLIHIFAKSGAWFSFGDIRLGQGKENVKVRLETEPELLAKIEEEVKNSIKPEKKDEKGTEKPEAKEGVLSLSLIHI